MAIMGLLGGLSLVNSGVSAATSLYKPAGRSLDYWANRTSPNNLNDPSVILTLYFKKKISIDLLYTSMEYYGYSKSQVDYQILAAQRTLDMTEYVQLWRRGIINDVQLRDYAEITQYQPTEVENLKRITEFFPAVGDLIRFAVREVYTPATVREYGMMDDIPPLFIQEAEKAGVPPEQARNFWAAHWELPSLGMGYEMFHRKIISSEQLDLLMKSQDVMPFWRDKLRQMSYNVLTRVDARRMYGFGVIDEDQLREVYEAQGYNPLDAQRMTDFTIKYEDDEYTGLTRSTIINSYKDGLLTEEELRAYLTGIGYGEDIIEYWVNQAVYEKTVADIKLRTNELRIQFVDGLMSLEEIRIALVQDGLVPTYINKVLNDFRREKASTRKHPPVSTLQRWLEKGVIDDIRYSLGMRRLGYDDETIALYMTEILDPDKPVVRKFLKDEQYLEWYQADLITDDILRQTFRAKGYNKVDIDILMSTAYDNKYNKPEEESGE